MYYNNQFILTNFYKIMSVGAWQTMQTINSLNIYSYKYIRTVGKKKKKELRFLKLRS